MADLQCINNEVSLFDLIKAKREVKGKITICQISGKTDDIKALKQEYKEIDQKIKALEDAAKTGTVSIRLM
jgi:hypothetical protein